MSPPIRVLALVGALAVTGLVAVLFLLARAPDATPTVDSPTVMRQTTSSTEPAPAATPASKAARAQVVSGSGLPPVIDRALRRHGVVVVAVYIPGAAVDSVVRAEARRGAIRARVGFVAVSALDERVTGPLVARAGVLPDPAVLVVKRPGIVTATLGVTDAGTIAQTALQAKR